MKLPKLMKRLCPFCRKHTSHKVSQAKKKTPGSANPLGKSSKPRTGFGKGCGNLGRYGSRPPLASFKMTGKKTTKKTDLRYECKECKKIHCQRKGFRAKRIEFQ